MWFPDLLPCVKTATFFRRGEGQAAPAELDRQGPSKVAPPLTRKAYNLIIHLDIVEDWSPPRDRTSSSGQSGVMSSVSSEEEEYPRIYNFDDWSLGVLDGTRQHPRHTTCRPQQHPPRHDEDDADHDDPRPLKGSLGAGQADADIAARIGELQQHRQRAEALPLPPRPQGDGWPRTMKMKEQGAGGWREVALPLHAAAI